MELFIIIIYSIAIIISALILLGYIHWLKKNERNMNRSINMDDRANYCNFSSAIKYFKIVNKI